MAGSQRVGKRKDYKLDVRQQAADLYLSNENYTHQDVADVLGVSRRRVGKYLSDLGIEPKRPRKEGETRRDRISLLKFAAAFWDVKYDDTQIDRLVAKYEEMTDARPAA